jgi:hypothetical protein
MQCKRACPLYLGGLSAFDDLVSAGKDCRRNGEAKGLRGLEVDEEFKFGRPFDRQIGGPFPLENLVNIDAGTSEDCALVGAIGPRPPPDFARL